MRLVGLRAFLMASVGNRVSRKEAYQMTFTIDCHPMLIVTALIVLVLIKWLNGPSKEFDDEG